MRFFFITLLMVSNTVLAQAWEFVTTSKTGTIYFIDSLTIIKEDKLVFFTQLLNYPNGYDPENHEIKSVRLSKQIDCKNNTSKTLTMIAYSKEDAKGDIQTLSIGKETEWIQINQNSILSLYKNKACQPYL